MNRISKVILGATAGFVTLLVTMASAYAQAGDLGVQYIERDKWIGVAAGFGIALAAFGGALGQGRTASTALDGIARNPGAAGKLFTPMILGLALIESLVIYSLIISILLLGKIH
jgi:F-type H+-transporting ATPase subunit c